MTNVDRLIFLQPLSVNYQHNDVVRMSKAHINIFTRIDLSNLIKHQTTNGALHLLWIHKAELALCLFV